MLDTHFRKCTCSPYYSVHMSFIEYSIANACCSGLEFGLVCTVMFSMIEKDGSKIFLHQYNRYIIQHTILQSTLMKEKRIFEDKSTERLRLM